MFFSVYWNDRSNDITEAIKTSSGQALVSINIIPTKINYGFLKKWFVPSPEHAVVPKGMEMLNYLLRGHQENQQQWMSSPVPTEY